jgi:hypothetical protein
MRCRPGGRALGRCVSVGAREVQGTGARHLKEAFDQFDPRCRWPATVQGRVGTQLSLLLLVTPMENHSSRTGFPCTGCKIRLFLKKTKMQGEGTRAGPSGETSTGLSRTLLVPGARNSPSGEDRVLRHACAKADPSAPSSRGAPGRGTISSPPPGLCLATGPQPLELLL